MLNGLIIHYLAARLMNLALGDARRKLLTRTVKDRGQRAFVPGFGLGNYVSNTVAAVWREGPILFKHDCVPPCV